MTQALASAAMLILLFLKTQAFNPAAAEALASAFDMVGNVLPRLRNALAIDDLAAITGEVLAEELNLKRSMTCRELSSISSFR
jgi:hypothetical protein